MPMTVLEDPGPKPPPLVLFLNEGKTDRETQEGVSATRLIKYAIPKND